jgi:hypothetical protein
VPPPSQAPQTTSAALAERLPALPGQQYPDSGTLTIDKGLQLNLFPAQAATIFRQNGATDVIYRGSADGDKAYLLLAVPTKSPANAQAVVDYLRQGGILSGYTKTRTEPFTVTYKTNDRRFTGTWYASADIAVTMWVSLPVAANQGSLGQQLDQALNSLRGTLPAN